MTHERGHFDNRLKRKEKVCLMHGLRLCISINISLDEVDRLVNRTEQSQVCLLLNYVTQTGRDGGRWAANFNRENLA